MILSFHLNKPQDHDIPIRYDAASAEGCGPKVVHWFEKRLGTRSWINCWHALCFTTTFLKRHKGICHFCPRFVTSQKLLASQLAKVWGCFLLMHDNEWILKSFLHLKQSFTAFDILQMTWKNTEKNGNMDKSWAFDVFFPKERICAMHSASSMKTDFRHLRRDPFLRILGQKRERFFNTARKNQKNPRQHTHGAHGATQEIPFLEKHHWEIRGWFGWGLMRVLVRFASTQHLDSAHPLCWC